MVVLSELEGSFWGTCLEDGKKYSQTVEKTFRVTMAALDPHKSKGNEPVCVCFERNKVEYLLCTLKPGSVYQQNMDLVFMEGEDIALYVKGKGSVHLTGYLEEEVQNFEGLSDYEDSEDEEEGEDEAEEEVVEDDDDDDEAEEITGKRKLKQQQQSKNKKAKIEDDEDNDDDDDDSDSDEKEVIVQKSKKQQKKEAKKDKAEKKVESEKKGEAEVSAMETSTSEEKKKKKKKKKKKNKSDEEKLKETSGKEQADSTKSKKKTIQGGVTVEEVKEGHGPEATNGKKVRVYYTGKLQSGKIFDACVDGRPFDFKLGQKKVIPGWEVGVLGMKVGGKRKLIIPPAMGYGSKGAGSIPPNSTLIFDIELKAVN